MIKSNTLKYTELLDIEYEKTFGCAHPSQMELFMGRHEIQPIINRALYRTTYELWTAIESMAKRIKKLEKEIKTLKKFND